MPLRLSLLKYRFGVDRYIAVSHAIKDVMVADGVDGNKIDVVHSCADLSRFEDVPRADLRSEFGWPADSVVVGNVSFLVGHKDHATLVRAAAVVRQTHPETRFVIAGEGELRPDIERLRDELDLGDAFVLAGFRDDVPSMLADVDIHAMSSHMEGLGGSNLEAMAMRVPVASTNAGGIGEYLEDNVNGLLVDVRDPEALAAAIVHLIEHPDDARRMAEAGRRTVEEQFSIPCLIEQTLAVYDRILAGS